MQEFSIISVPVLGAFWLENLYPSTNVVAYSHGPIDIQDPSKGLMNKIWRARLIGQDISLVSEGYSERVLFTKRCISAIDLTFDQNGRYLLLYLVGTDMWLYWFDPIVQGYIDVLLDTDVASARITLDDKRPSQVPNSQIILGYVKQNTLYYRTQLDRYTIPYLLQEGVADRLIKIGLSNRYRFQFLFEQNPFPVYEDPWPAGSI